MTGLFGTGALLITDLNLIIQMVSFILLLIALLYKAKGKFKIHGSIMGIAVLLHFVTFLVAMAPSFVGGFTFLTTEIFQTLTQIIWIHIVTGTLSLVLSLYLVLAWLRKVSNIKPCFGRKRIMDATAVIWAISLVFGIVVYVYAYM